jgi:hypothetical protein
VANHNFDGTALDKDVATSGGLAFKSAQHFFMDGGFKCSVAPDGVYLTELSAGHYVKLSGGTYTTKQLNGLWQGLARLGLRPY